MKKVYVQVKNGFPINVDIQNAIDGFEYLGYEPIGFTLEEIVSGDMNYRAKNNPVIGSIDAMSILLKSIGKYPNPIDFPSNIINSGLLNRDIQKMRLHQFIEHYKTSKQPKFVKPVQTKLFDGILISEEEHLSFFKCDDCDVFVSDPIDIVSEHRIYVHNKKPIYSCNYNGDFKLIPNFEYVDKLIQNYNEQPISYTIDVAILKDGSTTVVEFNDFWAIGSYGLYCVDYSKMLLDRYNEILSK